MVETKLDKRDERLLDIHGALYPFDAYETSGNEWTIKSPDCDVQFKTYKSFIRFIEDDIKEALLVYAINGELEEIKGV